MNDWRIVVRERLGSWTGRGLWLVVGVLLVTVGRADAENASVLAARLHATAATSTIDTAGLVPWHLKLDVQFFDAKGKPSEQGTVEEWWASPNETRVIYTTPSYTATLLQNKDGLFQTKSQGYPSAILIDLLDQIVHPIQKESEIDSAKLDLRKQSFGKVPLDCIMLDQPLKNVAYPPLGLFPTFCLDAGKDSLRITTELGSLMFVRNAMGTFQGRSVAVRVSANSADGVNVLSAHVSLLSTMQPTDADFVPGSDMESTSGKAARISAGMMQGSAVSQPPPAYPETARLKRITGTVMLRAIIGRDGRIEALHIVSTPDGDLAMAAIAAVKKWTYKPFQLAGVPVEVETTINVNFEMSN